MKKIWINQHHRKTKIGYIKVKGHFKSAPELASTRKFDWGISSARTPPRRVKGLEQVSERKKAASALDDIRRQYRVAVELGDVEAQESLKAQHGNVINFSSGFLDKIEPATIFALNEHKPKKKDPRSESNPFLFKAG